MFEWQVALGLELLVILVGFLVFLKAADDESRPRTFVKIVAIIVIIFAALLAVCTVTKAVLYALEDESASGKGSIFIFFNRKERPEPARPVSSPEVKTGKTTGPKEPLPEWKGDLQKKKWHERGELMKKKWAERNST